MSPRSDALNIVRTLWHGSPLTVFERLSLLSFAKHGHKVEVYAYSDLEVPDGVRLCDARQILPESQIFSYTSGPAKGSFAAFSNLFRIKLLAEKGGIWADADLLCLRPMHDLPEACVGRHQEDYMNGAFLRFPAAHPVCVEIYEHARASGSDIELGQMSGFVTETIRREGASVVILPVAAIYPVPWKDTWLLVDPDQRDLCEELAATSYCVHWWNTAITLVIGMPKEALPPVGSYLYEHAVDVLPRTDLKAWSIEVARPWIEGFKARQAEAAPDPALAADLERLRCEVEELRSELSASEQTIARVLSSKSWKLTAPLRALDHLINGRRR